MAPQNAFQTLLGLETLSLRMKKHVSNSIKIATWLEKHPKIAAEVNLGPGANLGPLGPWGLFGVYLGPLWAPGTPSCRDQGPSQPRERLRGSVPGRVPRETAPGKSRSEPSPLALVHLHKLLHGDGGVRRKEDGLRGIAPLLRALRQSEMAR